MTQETEPEPSRLAPPTMLTVIAAVALAELEREVPGLIDRMIGRLGSEALMASVISIRGPRAVPAVLEAQADALTWLTTLAPLLRADASRRRKEKR